MNLPVGVTAVCLWDSSVWFSLSVGCRLFWDQLRQVLKLAKAQCRAAIGAAVVLQGITSFASDCIDVVERLCAA
jgi:hypothetical protein